MDLGRDSCYFVGRIPKALLKSAKFVIEALSENNISATKIQFHEHHAINDCKRILGDYFIQ
jgi:hypothetical protein